METKKLLSLIKDDISDLHSITDDFNLESLPSADDIELALVRANGLLRQLELLLRLSQKKDQHLADLPPSVKTGDESEKRSELSMERFGLFDAGIDHTTDLSPVEDDQAAQTATPELSAEKSDEFASEVIVPGKEEEQGEIKHEIVTEVMSPADKHSEESNQLVNELLDPVRGETGYPVSRIDNLWDGIGINDRFLYTRELFENSSAKFDSAIAALNQLNTIQEAVNYLKLNFKWHKTEASQKFLVLVKRRFTK